MTAHAAFLCAVCATPEDDGPRLVYADYLDENGQAEWAEFIRLQCELAVRQAELGAVRRAIQEGRRGLRPPEKLLKRIEKLRQREEELLHKADWPGVGESLCRGVAAAFGATQFRGDYGFAGMSGRRWKLVRGFVAEIELTEADFLKHAGALFRAAPITRVRLSDKSPHCDHMGREVAHWSRLDSLSPGERPEACRLENCLYDLLPPGGPLWTPYADPEIALDALSGGACVRHGRLRAGLAVLPEPEGATA